MLRLYRVPYNVGSLFEVARSAVVRAGMAVVQRVATGKLCCSAFIPDVHYASVAPHCRRYADNMSAFSVLFALLFQILFLLPMTVPWVPTGWIAWQ